MSIGKTGHVLVRTSHSRGQPKGQCFQSWKSAMSGGLKLQQTIDTRRAGLPLFPAALGRPKSGIFSATNGLAALRLDFLDLSENLTYR